MVGLNAHLVTARQTGRSGPAGRLCKMGDEMRIMQITIEPDEFNRRHFYMRVATWRNEHHYRFVIPDDSFASLFDLYVEEAKREILKMIEEEEGKTQAKRVLPEWT